MKETGHLLNEKQKEVKQKIMEDCLEGLFGNILKNKLLFCDLQTILDLIFSVLIMFNREVLVHMIKNTPGLINNRKQIMKDLFENIKNEVDRKLKEEMN